MSPTTTDADLLLELAIDGQHLVVQLGSPPMIFLRMHGYDESPLRPTGALDQRRAVAIGTIVPESRWPEFASEWDEDEGST